LNAIIRRIVPYIFLSVYLEKKTDIVDRLKDSQNNNCYRYIVRTLITVIIMLAVMSCSKEKVIAPTDETTYYTDVKPIFSVKCATAGCHAGAAPAAGLSMETYDAIVVGSVHGSVVIPGKADASPLYRTMAGTSEPIMPITEKLDQSYIDLVGKWINDGFFESRQ
jgi:hypothetical protein